jgi:hypothetical protein
MWEDEVLEEIYRNREEHAKSFNSLKQPKLLPNK